MCGHYAGTTRGVMPSSDEYVRQFQRELALYDHHDIDVISIYNSGSMLNQDEVGYSALHKIFEYIHNHTSAKKIVLESRAEYIDSTVIESLLDILGPKRRLSIAIGLETFDDTIRLLCINKGCTTAQIERAVGSVKGLVDIQLYVLLGMPFLAEREALENTVKSLQCARKLGADEIHIEPLTLQRFTLAEILYHEGLLQLPSLYTLYEALRTVVPVIQPYVSPFHHMPRPDIIPQGCPRCTERLIDGLLNRYNINRNRENLEYEPCVCLGNWKKRLEKTDDRPLPQRIIDVLEKVNFGNYGI